MGSVLWLALFLACSTRTTYSVICCFLSFLSLLPLFFEGSLTLKFSDIAGHGNMVRNLCSVGVVVTWLVAATAAHYSLDLTWQLSFLFGAIVTVTGPTVIVPMLRTVRPKTNLANILRWEGIVIDPIGA